MTDAADFMELLRQGSAELFADHPERMDSGDLIPSPNVIAPQDVELFFEGAKAGLITLHRGARFNTCDRPTAAGHWGLLSRSREGGWYNAEYLPQIAAYVKAVLVYGHPRGRVFFELPAKALQLDLAIVDDRSQVIVAGEAKRSVTALGVLRERVLERYGDRPPGAESKKRGDEARQLAWRLWTVAPKITWLVGPGHREAFDTGLWPLRLSTRPRLPHAHELGLAHEPDDPITVPDLAGGAR
ncbi:hypothetical protein [Spirillospora sp. NPDC047279]|uniref:hypothetical protein n=1 Tax=Spirillospora sp. NPDC047279 TaxID=3155478 RepID=UPI0033C4DBAD